MKLSSNPGSVMLALVVALSVSCVHQQTAGKTAAPAPTPLNAWDQQIRNAVNVGDGDYQLGALRQKVAAEPRNVAVRVELAKAYRERGYHEIALEISLHAVARFPESGAAEL